MSAIAGIYYWNGKPVADAELACLATHCEISGPDGGGTIRPLPWLALQAFVLRFDRLSAIERQPYAFAEGSLLTWDGRLDNREDLLLALHRDLTADVTDAALVAAAYQRWGVDSVRRLVGDWSLAIWDARVQTLMLARDYMGIRPLYYREMPEGIAWASNLEALAACFDLYTPDEDYIAGQLASGVAADVTPFRSLRTVRAGHVLLCTPKQGAIVRRYWTFTPESIRYRELQTYAEHLRELLTDAVRVRLRADRTVWPHLSGGWDSSSIVCLAHRLIERGGADAPRVQPVSLIHTGAFAECNELAFIEAVERWSGRSAVRTEYTGYSPIARLIGRRLPVKADPSFLETLEAPIVEAGDRIVLSGSLGDQMMKQGAPARGALVEPLHEGHPLRFLRLCQARARTTRRPLMSTVSGLVRDLYLPRLGNKTSSRPARTEIVDGKIPLGFGLTAATLSRAAARSTPLPDLTDFPMGTRMLVQSLYHWADNRSAAPTDPVFRTYPYSHRPLAEFMLATPGLAFWEPGGPIRAGMRRALVDILPPEILNRTRKELGNQTPRAQRDFADELGLLGALEQWQLVKQGYLDPAALKDMASRFRASGGLLSFPSRWIYMEVWLQTLITMSRGTGVERLPPSNPTPVGNTV